MKELLALALGFIQQSIESSYVFLTGIGVPAYVIRLFLTFVIVLLICAWVWQLSKHLSKRDLFSIESRGQKTGLGRALFYVLEYLVLFPLYTIFWGGVLVFLLILMAVPEAYPNVIFFAAVIISAIRAIAYFNEEWAYTLAMQLPIVMLVTTVLNPAVLSKVSASTITLNLPYLLQTQVLLESIGFVVAMEWILRISTLVGGRKRKKPEVQ
jgi:hypothetical protein